MNTTEIRQQINEHLDRLSSERLQLVAEFLAYLADKESEEATQELLDIPGFIESFERGKKDITEGRVVNWLSIWEVIQKALAGISPEFNLKRYQEGLQERYSNLNLDSLDTSWGNDSEVVQILGSLLASGGQVPYGVGKALADISMENPEVLSILRTFIKPVSGKVMSQGDHFTTWRTRITDAEVLLLSLQDLGITVRTDADIRGYNGRKFRADIVAVLEGEYDIGWSLNSDGSYDMIADHGGLSERYDPTTLITCISSWVYQARKAWKDRGRI